MLDKKHIWGIFLFEFKMSRKAAETTRTSTTHVAQELEMYIQCSGGSRGFCKDDESLEDEKHCGWPFEGDSNQLKESSALILTQEVAEELNLDHSMVVWHLNQVGKMKKPTKWMPHELTANQKKHPFEVSSSLILHNNEPFLAWTVMCDEKWILYNCCQPAHCWTEKKLQSTSQSQTCTKKRWCSLFGGLLSVWSTTAFWILAKSLLLKSMLSKSMRCTENCNAGSWHWSTERAQFFSMTMPDRPSHNQHFKNWMN